MPQPVFYVWLVLGLCATAVLAGEQLKNPKFSQKLAHWRLHVHPSMNVKRHIDQGILTLKIDPASKPQHVQLFQTVTLAEGQQYKLSFDAKRNGKKVPTTIACLQLGKPFKNYGLSQTVKFSRDWSRYHFTFKAKGLIKGKTPTIRLFLGNQTSVQLRNFSLVEVTPKPSPWQGIYALTNKDYPVEVDGQTVDLLNTTGVAGVTYYDTWRKCEPTKGQWKIDRFADWFAAALKANRKLNIALLAGSHVPDWALEESQSPPYQYLHVKTNTTRRNYLPWTLVDGQRVLNEPMLKIWRQSVEQFSQQIRSLPGVKKTLGYIAITGGPYSNGLEIMWGVNKMADGSTFVWGAKEDQFLITYWQRCVDIFMDVFPDIPLGLAFTDVYGRKADGSPRRSVAVPKAIMDYAVTQAKLKKIRLIAQGFWIGAGAGDSHWAKKHPGQLLERAKTHAYPILKETHSLQKILLAYRDNATIAYQGPMGTSSADYLTHMLKFARKHHALFVELWHHDFLKPAYRAIIQQPANQARTQKFRSKSGAGEEYHGIVLTAESTKKTDDPKVSLAVHESQILQPVPPLLFGFNHNWLWSNRFVMEDSDTQKPVISQAFLKTLKGLPMPLNRMSGSMSQIYHWKWAMGLMSQRQPQKLAGHDTLGKKRLGPLEWVDSTLQIDPSATFSWTFNFKTETAKDHADLAELFTGDPRVNANGGINWAQKRVDYGLTEPIPMVAWELGNELDWGRDRAEWSVERYINACREVMAAVRRVHPQARFAAFAATAAWSDVHKKTPGGWRAWHRKVLKELGDQLDWIVFHPYYHGYHTAYVETYLDAIRDDIIAITGSDRIKVYISEHARWPARPKNAPWSTTWNTTHDLSGTLATAEFLNRCLQRPEIQMAAYHCLSGGPWGVFYQDKQSKQLYTTGIYDLFVQLRQSLGQQVVQSQLEGQSTKGDFTFTATAMTSDNQSLKLILVNRSESPRELILTTDKHYRFAKARIFTASKMSDFNTANQRPIATRDYPMDSKNLSRIRVPPHCMLSVQLTR